MTKIHFIKSLLKCFSYGPFLNPARDWLALLILFTMALTGIVVWNAWVFGTVAQGGIIGSVATSSPPIFDSSSLDAIRAIFADRSAEEIKYETGVYRFADPSQ